MALTSKNDRIKNALRVATQFGQTDGAHHKAWVIDQMMRALCGGTDKALDGFKFSPTPEYFALVREHNAGDDGPNTYAWDEGIAP